MGSNEPAITDLPFHERRYIAVVSDQEFDRLAQEVGPADPSGLIWPVLGVVGTALVPGALFLRISMMAASVVFAARSGKNPFVRHNTKMAAEKERADKKKASAIRPIRMRDARDLNIMSGSVEIGNVYAANPLVSRIYYPVKSYNDDLMDHKLSELERLLNALGATSYQIRFEESVGRKAKASTSASGIGGADADLERSRRRRFERSGTADGREPTMPDTLLWYDREPSWQALAESRLLHGRREFNLVIELERSFRISAQAAAQLSALKIDVGAKHEQNQNVVLSVTGTF